MRLNWQFEFCSRNLVRVWITRTEPGATRLAAALEAAGHTAWVRPVLRIEALRSSPPPGPFDLTIFLSEHAVHAACANGWRETPALAIGPGTRAALRTLGVLAATPQVATSEGIVDFLASAPPSRALLAAGEGGRDVLGPLLKERGVAVVQWALYRRVAVSGPLPDSQQVDAIVAASEAGLRVAADLWFATGRNAAIPRDRSFRPCCRSLPAPVGFTRVLVSPGAGARATVATLERVATGR